MNSSGYCEDLPVAAILHLIANKGVVKISTLRQYEKLSVKYALQKLHLQYFDKCLELDLIPEFLKFKPPRLDAYRNSKAYFTKAVNEQRKVVGAKLKDLNDQYEKLTSELISRLSSSDYRLLVNSINTHTVEKAERDRVKQHNGKLYKLWKKQRPPVPDCIVNISSKQLNLSEEKALMFGLNHHILPSKVNPLTMRANIDDRVRKICKFNNILLTYDSKASIREATDRFIHEAERVCNTKRNNFLHRTLRQLANNDDIKVCKMDKGVGVVIVDTPDYYQKLDVIIDDDDRFELLNYNINTTNIKECDMAPWIRKEDSIARYCREYIRPLVDNNTYFRLYPTGSQPGKLYGMAKNHKDNCPMRPVLSAVNTPEYHLAKWLEKNIKLYLNNEYSVASSSVFLNELTEFKPRPSDVCVSFDIKSLFTNVPLKEVIDDIKRTLYPTAALPSVFVDRRSEEDQKKKKYKKLTGTVFKHMLEACSESIFLYRNNVYRQKDGVAMGSPLAPILAEWFVSKVEQNIFKKDISFKPLFYKRYVDDIFAVFRTIEDRDSFYGLLNNVHRNLTFTMETTTGFLPFLDIAISVNDDKFDTKVYRKPTNTGVVMNFNSNAPMKWKKSLVKYMLLRAYRLSSSFNFFQSEVTKIRDIFRLNSYPSHLIEEILRDFTTHHNIDETHFKCGNMDKSQEARQRTNEDPEPKNVYFKLPFFGRPSRTFQRQIREQLKAYNLNVRAAFTTTKVASYFCLKSQPSVFFKAGVVYRFTCARDERISYIGETRRQFYARITDHCTGRDKKSAVFGHLYGCTQCQNVDATKSFEVLQTCDTSNICTMEAILIAKHRPELNIQLGPGKGTMVSLALYNN